LLLVIDISNALALNDIELSRAIAAVSLKCYLLLVTHLVTLQYKAKIKTNKYFDHNDKLST